MNSDEGAPEQTDVPRTVELQLMPGTPGIYEVAGISVQELVNNETALKLLLHTFRQTADENISLKQQQNFDKSEITRVDREKQNLTLEYNSDSSRKTIGSASSFAGSIPIAFGVNILTSNSNANAGWLCLGLGLVLSTVGLVLSFYKNFRWKA